MATPPQGEGRASDPSQAACSYRVRTLDGENRIRARRFLYYYLKRNTREQQHRTPHGLVVPAACPQAMPAAAVLGPDAPRALPRAHTQKCNRWAHRCSFGPAVTPGVSHSTGPHTARQPHLARSNRPLSSCARPRGPEPHSFPIQGGSRLTSQRPKLARRALGRVELALRSDTK